MEGGGWIGPYELVRELGRGGMGVVYEARREGAPRLALKLLLDDQPEFVRRFHQEVRLQQALGRHPHVVRLLDAGEHGGRPYLVMPLLTGGTLGERIASGAPPLDTARLLLPIARALEVAHALGVVHRDLKPENVLLGADGSPCLADFGVAKDLRERTLTQTGVVVGSLAYMAPEQLDARPVDARTDVYALGAILFHVLTGRRPFERAGASLLKQIVADPPPRPRELAPTVPSALEAVCLRALAKEPAARQPSAEAFAHELEAALAGAAVRSPQPSQPPQRLRARRSLLAASAAGLVLGVVSGGPIGFQLGRGEAPKTRARPLSRAPAAGGEASARADRGVGELLAAAGGGDGATLEQRAVWIERAAALDFEATLAAATSEHTATLAEAALAALQAITATSGEATAQAVTRARERTFLARLLDPERDLRPQARELTRLWTDGDAQVRQAARPWAWALEPDMFARIAGDLLEPGAEPREAASEDPREQGPSTTWLSLMRITDRHATTSAALREWLLWRPELPWLWLRLGELARHAELTLARRALEQARRPPAPAATARDATAKLVEVLMASGRWEDATRTVVDLVGRTAPPAAGTNPLHVMYAIELLVRTGAASDAELALAFAGWLQDQPTTEPFEERMSYWLAIAKAHAVLGRPEQAEAARESAQRRETW